MADTPPLTDHEDGYAWAVIACVAELLAPEAEVCGGGVQAAFEVVEDALAERRQAWERAHGGAP